MAVVSLTALKAYFETGDFPTQAQFVDLIDTLGGSASGTELLQTSLTIATADVLTLFTVPLEIIPAPGAGYAIEVISAVGRITTYGGSPYATNTSLILYTDTGSTSEYQAFNSTLLPRTAASSKKFTTTAVVNSDANLIIENKSIKVAVSTGNPTNAGTGSDIIVYVAYRLIAV